MDVKGLLMIAGVGFAAVSSGISVKDGTTDWTLPESYEPAGVPAAGATVEIPDGATVTVQDAASMAIVGAFERIYPKGSGAASTLIVSVPADTVWTNGAALFGSSDNFGKLIKRGAGELYLGALGTVGDVASKTWRDLGFAYVSVEAGSLRCSTAANWGVWTFGRVTVAENATFHLPLFDYTTAKGTAYFTFLELWGAGDVCYDEAGDHSALQMRITSACTFGGRIRGRLINPFLQGCVTLSGEASDFAKNITASGNYGDLTEPNGTHGGIVYVKKLGLKGTA